MKKGIGPNNLGVSKRVPGVGKMYKAAPTKLDTDPPKNKASLLTRADANMANRAQKSSRKPAAEQGSMQEFLNEGPVPFIKRGYKSVKKSLKDLDNYIGGQTQKEATKDLNNRRFK